MKSTRTLMGSGTPPSRLTTHLTPRMSVNKLGQYTVATALGRQTIVRDQKYPSPFIAARYQVARDAIAECLADPKRGTGPVVEAIRRLSEATFGTPWAEQDRRLSIEALERFMGYVDRLPPMGAVAHRGGHIAPTVDIEGVEVSVRPEVVFRGVHRGKPSVGALKVRFSKNDPIDDEAAANVTTVLHHYVERVVAAETEAVSHRQCLLLDVFDGRVHEAPQAVVTRRRTIAAVCREICLWWPTLEDPRNPRPFA